MNDKGLQTFDLSQCKSLLAVLDALQLGNSNPTPPICELGCVQQFAKVRAAQWRWWVATRLPTCHTTAACLPVCGPACLLHRQARHVRPGAGCRRREHLEPPPTGPVQWTLCLCVTCLPAKATPHPSLDMPAPPSFPPRSRTASDPPPAPSPPPITNPRLPCSSPSCLPLPSLPVAEQHLRGPAARRVQRPGQGQRGQAGLPVL